MHYQKRRWQFNQTFSYYGVNKILEAVSKSRPAQNGCVATRFKTYGSSAGGLCL
jgi:hypothetical protein